MSELVEIVDSLENKISKLLHKIELLHQTNIKLEEELVRVSDEHEKSTNGLSWQTRCWAVIQTKRKQSSR